MRVQEEGQPLSDLLVSAEVESADRIEPALESASNGTIITQAVDPYPGPTGWTSNLADSEGTPKIGKREVQHLYECQRDEKCLAVMDGIQYGGAKVSGG